MTYSITLGQHQLAMKLSRKRGRPRKTVIQRLDQFLSQLISLATDKRYSGQPISRVLRFVFEHREIRKVLGLNLAIIALFASVAMPPISAFNPRQPVETSTVVANKEPLITEKSVRVPVDSFQVTQGYHALHRGIDLNEIEGAPVYPIMNGTVERTFHSHFSYGNHILIDHGSGFKSLYAHLAKIVVKEGEEVDKNTVIGTVGQTGWATGSHLHLEVYENGRTFNPLTILK